MPVMIAQSASAEWARMPSSARVGVVVPVCKERDVSWINSLPCEQFNIYVHQKDCGAYDALPLQPRACVHVERTDNRGREALVYVDHIRRQYSTLEEMTWFLQNEGPRAASDLLSFRRVEDRFRTTNLSRPTVGFMPLREHTCCETYPDDVHNRDWHRRGGALLCHLFSSLTGRPCAHWTTNLRAQFVVSARRIRTHPRTLYDGFATLLRSELNPVSHTAHVFERLWPVLFGCWAPASRAGHTLLLCLDGPRCPPNDDGAGCGPNRQNATALAAVEAASSRSLDETLAAFRRPLARSERSLQSAPCPLPRGARVQKESRRALGRCFPKCSTRFHCLDGKGVFVGLAQCNRQTHGG